MKKIEFFRHEIRQEDIRRAASVMRSVFLTTGDEVATFEADFAAYLGARYVVGVTSCTAALHLSLLAWGIGAGDEVITTPMTFCATANAILHAGATPVFVDVEEDTGNINADRIESSITRKTRAIIPVHLYGQMCDMKKIREIADKHRLVIIEDAAHAIEASRDGIRVGELADAACFSFYATKNITSGEGGAVSVHDKQKSDVLKMLRSHGIDRAAAERYTKRYRHYDMPILGWKYNMDNIQAALLLGQLKRIDLLWEQRKRLWNYYRSSLENMPGLRLLNSRPSVRHAMHLFTILVNEKRRDEIMWKLQDKGVGVAVNYRPIHLFEYYRKTLGYRAGNFPVAEQIGRRTISLPFYPKLKKTEAQHVIDDLKTVLVRSEK